MAYDEQLASRIRDLVAGTAGLSEQKMFGGLAFLVGGNMAVAASGQGGLLVRVDPDQSADLVARTPAWPPTPICAPGSSAAWPTPRRCRPRAEPATAPAAPPPAPHRCPGRSM